MRVAATDCGTNSIRLLIADHEWEIIKTGAIQRATLLNQLLAEMDGFDRSAAIVILAATNRPEILDPALLRAGRFDRQVLVDRPDKVGRVQILKIHLRKLTLAPDVQLDDIAALTPGFTGADLANLANEAAVVATRRGADAIAMADFTAAVDRFRAVLDRQPDDQNATLLLGMCLRKQGPRAGDARLEALERIKTNYEERAYLQLKSLVTPSN